ncbi:hypothetical protein F4604DRAFT_982214 [Suillus subluteus]|nr:hypothetical protein F4604DRAFT_982214 [Suillus subluteus]
MELFPSRTRTRMVTAVSMAATWLLAVVLVRNPTTRRICLKDAIVLSILCWAFCGLWIVALLDNDCKTVEMWSLTDVLKQNAFELSSTLAWALEFMVMLSFWGNLKWKHPIATVWCLVSGILEEVSHDLIPSENNLDLFAYSSLPHEDPDLSYLSDWELDEKPDKLEV